MFLRLASGLVLRQNTSRNSQPIMKILAISDEIIERLYTPSVRETYPDVRMLLGCGDLPYAYLEFLVTVFNVPLFYVPGNHDPAYGSQASSRAEGGTNLDGEVTYARGLLMAGLGGSIMYHPGAPNQYTQAQMYLAPIAFCLKFSLAAFVIAATWIS